MYEVYGKAIGNDKAGQKLDIESFLTIRIKTLMAPLLYPVDMGDVRRPTRDPKFRAQVMELQGRRGEPRTGVLLSGQFDRLSQAATTLNERKVYPPIGLIIIGGNESDNSRYVAAKGTWRYEDAAFPINYVNIHCSQVARSCTETEVDVVMPNQFSKDEDFNMYLSATDYQVVAWDLNEVTAYLDGQCRRTTITINTSTKTAHSLTTDLTAQGCKLPDGTAFPALKSPRVAVLVDPFTEAKKVYDARQKEAQKLIYLPTQALILKAQ